MINGVNEVGFCPDLGLFDVIFEWDDLVLVKVIQSRQNSHYILYGHILDAIYK